MPEKEKVMTITIMRTDLYDAPGYTGAYLTLPAVNRVPEEYRKELLGLLDYEKIGYEQREAEGGSYCNGFYIVNGPGEGMTVYDVIHPAAEQYLSEDCVFELMVCDGTFFPSDIDECTMLKLPATQKELAEVLEEQDIKSFGGRVVYTNKSSIPKLNGVFDL